MDNEITITDTDEQRIRDMARIYWPDRKIALPFKHIPYGYVQKEGDPTSLVPDLRIVAALDQVFDAIDIGTSTRAAASFLTENGFGEVSHNTISKLWKKIRGSDPNNPRLKRLEQIKEDNKPLTIEHKKRRTVNQKIGAAKRKIGTLAKKIEALQEKVDPAPKEEEVRSYTLDTEEVEDDKEILFKPHPGPQTAFLASSEQEVLYGGAAGGGKSYALIGDPMRYFDNKYFNGLVIRRTNDELRELIWLSQDIYPKIFKGAKWSQQSSTWTFPAAGHMRFNYLEKDDDVRQYQGHQFCWIAFDELTQWPTPFAWNYLRSRLRAPLHSGLPLFMRGTTNPGGPGHGWVKRMFIDPAPAGVPFDARDEDGRILYVPVGDPDFPEERWGKPLFQRRFIPAKLSDNPSLAQGGQYKANLLSLPEQQRRQLLEGDWDIADGAAFSEWRASKHVIEPAEIPPTWRRFRSCDFGYSSFSAVHWYAIEPQTDRLYVYRELYISKATAKDLAKKILELEQGEKISYGVLDSSCWSVRGQTGPSIAEEMIMEGCKWRPSDRTQGSRIAGRNRLHELLKDNPFDGKPNIQFFNTCRQIISDLPIIPTDPDGSDDIDVDYASDHAYDSIRYGIMTRPRAAMPFDPFDQGAAIDYDYIPSDPIFGY